jgi:tetratricopeptide (TPR) repeat protein
LSACDHALSEYGLSSIRRSENRHSEAANLMRDVYQRMVTCSGPEAPYTLNAQAYLAESLIATGHVGDALQMLEKSEPLWQRPPVNSNVAFTNYWILGHAYVESARYGEAEKVLTASLRNFGGTLPPNDKRAAWTRYLLARALAGQGRNGEALPIAEMASSSLSNGATTPLARSNAEAARALLTQLRSH